MQQVYSKEVMHGRHILTLFLQRHFQYNQRTLRAYRRPLAAHVVYRLFANTYPTTPISEADFIHYMMTIGELDGHEVFLDSTVDQVLGMSAEVFNALAPHMTREAASVRMYKKDVTKMSLDRSQNAFHVFMRLFVRSARKHSPVGDLYDLYTHYCLTVGTPPLTRGAFTRRVQPYYPVKKGYANGTSGISVLMAEVPPDALQELSLQHGLGLFHHTVGLIDSTGQPLPIEEGGSFTKAAQDYIKKRKEHVYHESDTTTKLTQKTQAAEDDTGREDEVPETAITEGTPRGKPYTDDVGSDASTKPVTSKPAPSIISLADIKLAKGNSVSTLMVPLENKPGTTGVDAIASGDDDADTDDPEAYTDGDEEYTLEDIFDACLSAYGILPAAFTQKELQNYISAVGASFKAEDVWQDFLEYVEFNS